MWNVAATMPRDDRRAGWGAAAVLGALLVLPAPPASGDTPRTEQSAPKAAAAKSSSGGSKASRPASPRSRPAASRSTASRSRPSASRPRASRPSASRSRPTASRSSSPRDRSRAIRNERSRSDRGSRATTIERSRPLPERRSDAGARTGSRGDAGTMTIERSRPFREAPTVREQPVPRGGSPVEGIGPSGEIDGAAPDLRHRREYKDPGNGGYPPPRAGRDRGHGGHGHGHRHGGYHRHRHYYGCGHYGFGYDPFYWGFGYYSPYAYWGLGYYGGYGYYAPNVYAYGGGGGSSRRSEVALGALDLDVRPDKAEVYVDGNFVGVADQYDGYPSYLWLEEGSHELAFYLEGYETVYLRYTIYPGVTIDVDVHLRQGESVRPGPPPGVYPGEAPAERESGLPGGDEVGRIAIAATPGDAAVYLDGHFVGTAEEIAQLTAGLILEPGDHLVEVTRPGYETRSLPVSVAVGEQIDVRLDLERR